MTPDDFVQAYAEALTSQNWRNVEPLLHEKICVTFSTGTFKGKPEVRKAFERNFSAIKDEQYSISDLYWIYRSNDTAVCIYDFSWKGFINGQSRSGGGRGTSVLLNVDIQWRLITEHLGPSASNQEFKSSREFPHTDF